MKKTLILPRGYKPSLNILQTEVAIKFIKDTFEQALAKELSLTRVSAPLFVRPESGLNDNLNGVERPVSFDIAEQPGVTCEIVHSLAKWKRQALATYGVKPGNGLYTDMNAIRRDEVTDNLHSIYVDQWDWERVIEKSERSTDFLREIVGKIYRVIRETSRSACEKFGLSEFLPEDIFFITTAELLKLYPTLSPRERENAVAKAHGAVFISQIGGVLENGEKHDGRAPDYDDWALNGDIIVYYPVLESAVELSSMGIRVDEKSLVSQLTSAGCLERLELPFQSALREGRLPYTIGGGIGQSRLCMVMLGKAHVGEVQSSVWPEEDARLCSESGIALL